MMMMSKETKQYKKPLPIGVIDAASNGDIDAMDIVLNHYRGYIHSLCIVKMYDEYGNKVLFLDETLKSDLEALLITKVFGFKSTD
jgi:hypothetical protein